MFCKAHKFGLLVKSVKTTLKIGTANIGNRSQIGNRDWVAFGFVGNAYYDDNIFYPFPAIRFRENTNELLALKEKEKGDWRKLTLEEKKTLYRASFRQTFAEVYAPTGEWKTVLGGVLLAISVALWAFYGQRLLIFGPLPPSFSEENRKKMLKIMLVNRSGHLTGYASKWDYEKDDWK